MPMTGRQQRLMMKNVEQWEKFIEKLESKDKLSADEKDDLEMRKAQVIIWRSDLKRRGDPDFNPEENAGDMSASDKVATKEKASGG